MNSIRLLIWCWAAGIAATSGLAHGAWNNVFQVTCHLRTAPSTSQYYAYYGSAADPCCAPCQQQCCSTKLVEKSYYVPVTTYQTKVYYEPVTTYRRSFYWEKVVSYKYTSHYNPATCSYEQTACPTTCYKLRSQCCPVQSFVQRCCTVPVTSQKLVTYYEPVTTCATVDPCGNIAPQRGLQPNVGEERSNDKSKDSPYESKKPPSSPQTSNPSRGSPANAKPQQKSTGPKVVLERIVAIPTEPAEGQLASRK
jgi:hypothetical protein